MAMANSTKTIAQNKVDVDAENINFFAQVYCVSTWFYLA
jgi:hypothetical protein